MTNAWGSAMASNTAIATVTKRCAAAQRLQAGKHEAYEDGKHGYRKDYGDKKLYKEQYRKGFLRAYEDAFNRRSR
jgi:hypothetical protein